MNVNFNPSMSKTNIVKNIQNTSNTNNSIVFHGSQDYMYRMNEKEKIAEKTANKLLKYIGAGLGALLVSIGGINSCKVVGPGERGVSVILGKVQPDVLNEGIHAKWPFIESVKTMDVKTQKTVDSTEVYTKDVQQAKVEYALNYNAEPNNVAKLFQEIDRDYTNTVINPEVLGTIKDVIGKWNAQDLIGNREKATTEIRNLLNKSLKKSYINVTNFQITNIDYSDAFEKSIEDKVIAEQDALKSKNKTVQVNEEAKQKVIAAEAEAKSMAIRAEALSQNKNLVEYEAVLKWDGKLPQYMMGNSVPFINLNTKGN